MPHAFPLEAVLRLRKHKEDAEERALAALAAHRQQVETTLGRVRQQMRQWTEDHAREKGSAGTGATQQGSYARLAALRDAERQLEEQLADLRRRSLEQQSAYLAARRARETLTELKQNQQDSWNTAEQRREQRRLEDLFLGRWSR